jgi:uncharacterized cupin superfamily protein
MQEIIIKNVKTAEYKDVSLNKIFDPEAEHKKSLEFKNSTVSAPHITNGKLYVTFYTLMPGKANYPYHYHSGMEEVFYIISGTGILKTPDGEKMVTEGDVIVCPANATGAHQLINTSVDVLIYLDVDTASSPEVVFYPDKGDFRILTSTTHKNFSLDTEVNFLRNE